MSKGATHRWAAYVRNQDAVAAAIARKDYVDMTGTGAEVVDELFALMDQTGIMSRLEVEGVYQRRLVPMVLEVTTYSARIIMGLSSQNQLPTHLFRDAGLLRRIGYTARQVEEGFCKRGKGKARPIHKNTLADALGRLPPDRIGARHLRRFGNGSGQGQIGERHGLQSGWLGIAHHEALRRSGARHQHQGGDG
ncbi:MAG: hypothetical protein Q8N45_07635 [Anaerolineales bacterium]|nr:hypothetical protein [Anaerolineales bacterium]